MKKVLIVEDHKEVVDTMKVFMSQDLDVTFAPDFQAAEKELASQSFDCVVTDFNFPGGNGDDVAALAVDKGIRVVLHSSEISLAKAHYATRYEKMDTAFMKALMNGNF
jgi:DNA-binding response OmpR family regulator